MCLAYPAKIIEKNEADGTVELAGNRYQANLVLVPDAQVGDYVLVHAGYAIQVVTADEAHETWDIFKQIKEKE